MKKNLIPWLLVTFLFINVLTACSTTYVPLKSSVNKISIKIENHDVRKSYNLHSTIDKKGIAGRVQNESGIITYDISGFSKNYENCYFIHDGKEYIPIKDKIYKFSNPAITPYLNIENKLNAAQKTYQNNFDLLNNSEAYRDRECILLTENDMPEKPSSACSPREEEDFSLRRCQNTDFNPTTETKLKNGLICGTGGLLIGYFNSILGIGASAACDAYLSKTDKEDQYNRCISDSRNSCRNIYNNWVTKVRYLRNNSEQLFTDCIQLRKAIKESETNINQLKEELSISQNSWVQVSENNYCH